MMAIDVSCVYADEKTGEVSKAPDTEFTMADAASCHEKNFLNFNLVTAEAMACVCGLATCAVEYGVDTHVVTDSLVDKAIC